MAHVPHDPDEIIDIVNEADEVIGTSTRKEAHRKGLLHREVYCYIIGKAGVLLQRRSDNHLWDHSVGGHCPTGQSYEEAAIREAQEELGIKITVADLERVAKVRIKKTSHSGKNDRLGVIFFIRKQIPMARIDIDDSEIEEAMYLAAADLRRLLAAEGKLTAGAKENIRKYVLPALKQ
jgi:isopentenyl-diphosphate delta-isomerase